jgi:hypothetical protein
LVNNQSTNDDQIINGYDMTPETRAKKDKCTLAVYADGDKLRILGASDDPLVILKGQVCELRAVGKQVHVIQRHAVRESPPSPPDPHEDSGSDDFEE